jgi:hypothetical protein
METHVYLNGKYREKTGATRKKVIAFMRKHFGTTLLRERLVAAFKDQGQHRERRFATQGLLQPARRARIGIERRR